MPVNALTVFQRATQPAVPIVLYARKRIVGHDNTVSVHSFLLGPTFPQTPQAGRTTSKKIDPLSQLLVRVVTHSESNIEKVRRLHEQDQNARWIKVRRNEAGRPEVYIWDRFMKACCY